MKIATYIWYFLKLFIFELNLLKIINLLFIWFIIENIFYYKIFFDLIKIKKNIFFLNLKLYFEVNGIELFLLKIK